MPVIRSAKDRTIYRITEFDLLRQPVTKGNMYYCTDSRRVYEDINSLPNGRRVFACTVVATEQERLYTVRPMNGTYYYIYETNSLFLYNGGWNVVIGSEVYNKFNINYEVPTGMSYVQCTVDGNGLLGDGSVVVRDANKLIKGKAYIDATDNTLVITSFLGGGIRLLPSGAVDEKGSLSIKDGQFRFYGDQFQVAATIVSNTDMYVQKEKSDGEHRYKVYTEEDFIVGEWEFDGYDVVDKLNRIEQPLNLDVKKFDGHTSDYYSKVGHKHVSSDITDLVQFIKDNRYHALMSEQPQGLSITYNANDPVGIYKFSVNSFTLSFIGGATGYGTVNSLTDTEISLTVDPNKHKHKATDLTDWNSWIDNFDKKYMSINSFNEEVVSVAKPNKILRLNKDARLPADVTGNAGSASKWQFSRNIVFTGGVTASFSLDGSRDLTVPVVVDPNGHTHSQYVKYADVGVSVAPLINNVVPLQNLPSEVKGCVKYIGTFTPSDNKVPSSNPTIGNYWISTSNGTVGGLSVYKGDMIIYEGSWRVIRTNGLVLSVNNKVGNVVLNIQDVIDADPTKVYDPNNPQEGKVVLTEYDEDSERYILNTTTKYANRLSHPFKIQFINDGVTSNMSTRDVYELSTGDEVTYIKAMVDVSTTDVKIDDGNINIQDIIKASNATYKISSGQLTTDKVKQITSVVAYDSNLSQISMSNIDVNSDQLKVINSNISSGTKGSYPIELGTPNGYTTAVNITLL